MKVDDHNVEFGVLDVDGDAAAVFDNVVRNFGACWNKGFTYGNYTSAGGRCS